MTVAVMTMVVRNNISDIRCDGLHYKKNTDIHVNIITVTTSTITTIMISLITRSPQSRQWGH